MVLTPSRHSIGGDVDKQCALRNVAGILGVAGRVAQSIGKDRSAVSLWSDSLGGHEDGNVIGVGKGPHADHQLNECHRPGGNSRDDDGSGS